MPAQVRTIAADSVVLGVSCLISYWLTTRVLSLAYSVSATDDALGGMWAVIATVFVYRNSYTKSQGQKPLPVLVTAGRRGDFPQLRAVLGASWCPRRGGSSWTSWRARSS